jgi:hypothetical protein
MGTAYYSMILDAINRGALLGGMTKGLITLLHKGKGQSSVNNWHPITLLNMTYKIFAMTIQIRFQPIF